MKYHPLAAAAVVAVLSVSVGACGVGSDGESKASPSRRRPRPPRRAPRPRRPRHLPPPAQPTGAYGVTYEIQNWEQYATDPAVLAWKQTLEGVGGSINSGQVRRAVRARHGQERPARRTSAASNRRGRTTGTSSRRARSRSSRPRRRRRGRSWSRVCGRRRRRYITKDGSPPTATSTSSGGAGRPYQMALSGRPLDHHHVHEFDGELPRRSARLRSRRARGRSRSRVVVATNSRYRVRSFWSDHLSGGASDEASVTGNSRSGRGAVRRPGRV